MPIATALTAALALAALAGLLPAAIRRLGDLGKLRLEERYAARWSALGAKRKREVLKRLGVVPWPAPAAGQPLDPHWQEARLDDLFRAVLLESGRTLGLGKLALFASLGRFGRSPSLALTMLDAEVEWAFAPRQLRP